MGKKYKVKVQSLVFSKKVFPNKRSVRDWVEMNGFVIDTRLKKPILNDGVTFRVRQKNPDWFNKKTFKLQSLGRGVKGVYGMLKR